MHRIWSALFPNPRFYGWVVVGLCFLCSMLSSPGQSFVLSLYLEHLITDLGLSRLELSSIYGAMTLLAAVSMPFVGSLADRFDGKRFLAVVLLLLGLACLLFSQVDGLVGVAIAYFLLRLLGQGAIGLGTLTVVVRWFRQYRSRALAVVNLGYAAGEAVFPALILVLIAGVGWRGSMVSFGLANILVFAPLMLLLLRKRGADEPFDGEHAPGASKGGAVADVTVSVSDHEPNFELREVLRMPSFWVLAFCVSVLPLVVTAVIFHQVALFESLGWAKPLIAAAFAGFAGARVITTYLTGLALERFSSRFGISIAMFIATFALGATALPFAGPVASMVYGAGLGMATGALSSSNSVVWPEYYGIAALGAVKGVVTSIRNAATAVGPPLVALLAGPEEHFGLAVVVLAAMCIATAVIAPFVRPPKVPASSDDESASLSRLHSTESR